MQVIQYHTLETKKHQKNDHSWEETLETMIDFHYEQYDKNTGDVTYPKIELGNLIAAYEIEAAEILKIILIKIKTIK